MSEEINTDIPKDDINMTYDWLKTVNTNDWLLTTQTPDRSGGDEGEC